MTARNDGAVAIFGGEGRGGVYDGKGGFTELSVLGVRRPPLYLDFFARQALFVDGTLFVVHKGGWLLKRRGPNAPKTDRTYDDQWDWVYDGAYEGAASQPAARSAWGASQTDIHLATEHGLMRFDGKVAARDAALGATDLCWVLGTSDGGMLVATCDGAVYRRAAGKWRRLIAKEASMWGVKLTATGAVFANAPMKKVQGHSQGYELKRERGGRWASVWSHSTRKVNDLWGLEGDEIWGVAADAPGDSIALRFDGRTWTEEALNDHPSRDVYAPTMYRITGDDTYVYITGVGGVLLRKRRPARSSSSSRTRGAVRRATSATSSAEGAGNG